MHQAQSEEFELLVDLFRDNPESFWRGNRRPATQWDKDKFEQALNLYGINPVADPNTPSHLHRIMKATALKQLQASNPGLYDARAVDEQVLRMIGFDDAESLFAPPQPPQAAPPDPKMANVQFQATAKAAELQQRAQIKMAELEDKDKERKLKAELAMVDLARTLAVHPEAEKMAERTLAKSSNPPGQLQ
jgi:hypothetical protein